MRIRFVKDTPYRLAKDDPSLPGARSTAPNKDVVITNKAGDVVDAPDGFADRCLKRGVALEAKGRVKTITEEPRDEPRDEPKHEVKGK